MSYLSQAQTAPLLTIRADLTGIFIVVDLSAKALLQQATESALHLVVELFQPFLHPFRHGYRCVQSNLGIINDNETISRAARTKKLSSIPTHWHGAVHPLAGNNEDDNSSFSQDTIRV